MPDVEGRSRGALRRRFSTDATSAYGVSANETLATLISTFKVWPENRSVFAGPELSETPPQLHARSTAALQREADA